MGRYTSSSHNSPELFQLQIVSKTEIRYQTTFYLISTYSMDLPVEGLSNTFSTKHIFDTEDLMLLRGSTSTSPRERKNLQQLRKQWHL